LLCAALLVANTLSPPLLAATPNSTPKQCGYTGGPACPSPPPEPSPWQYTVDPHYDGNFPNTAVHNFDDVDRLYQLKFQGGGWCSATPDSRSEEANEWGSVPAYQYGILVGDSYLFTYNDIGYSSVAKSSPPYCDETFQSAAFVHQYRTLACLKSEGTAPSCGLTAEAPTKEVGCPRKCLSTVVGDPVDVANGNNFDAETDYLGKGNNSLEFVRYYNSRIAAFNWADGTTPVQEYMGSNWTATYFQRLAPISVTDSNGTHSAVYAHRPDGRVLVFTQYNGAGYFPDGDVADSVAQTATGWEYQDAQDTIETYDSSGALTSVATRGHAPVTVNYSSPGDPPASVTDAFGHTLTFAYGQDVTGNQRLVSITDPAGLGIQFGYDSNGNLSTVTHQDHTQRQYTYGQPSHHALQALIDEASVTYASWTYVFNGAGVATSQLAGGVESYSYGYTNFPNSVTVTDPFGQTRTFSQRLLLGVYLTTGMSGPSCLGCNEDRSRALDGNGNVSSRTDFNGNQTSYSYDVTTNLETSRTEAVGTTNARTITTQWDTDWRRPDLITEPNRSTGYTYDSMGNVLTQTVTDLTTSPSTSRIWRYTYDSYGRMLTSDGPRTDVSDVATYTYYTCATGFECGQVRTVTDAAGNVTTYNTYNAHGQPLTITDPNGVLTTLSYDTRQRLLSRSVGGETTSLSYYPTGLLNTVTLPDSSTLTYSYDGAHRLTQISDALGNKIVYTLDARGNRTAENTYDPSNALHRKHTRVFNTLNELYQDVNAAATAAVTTTYAYDNNGNQTSAAAPLSRNTGQLYDALNRLKQITDPANGVSQFGYDANDNLVSVSDPRSLVTSYGYNGFGDLVSQSSPDAGGTASSYDSGGNLLTATDARGAVSTYAYDALNRVTSLSYSLGGTTDQTITFSYDAGPNGKGRLTGASDASHSLSWSYDSLGRVASKAQTVGGVTRSVGYGYTAGDLTSLTTPSGQTVTYGYNSNHQVTSVSVNGTTVLTGVTYEPLGPIDGWTWGNSATTSRSYDGDGNLTQISSNGLQALTYDNASRVSGITSTAVGASNWTYGYDALDRMTSGGNGTISRGWTYDANGNRLTETGTSPSTYSVSPTSNQITAITGALARTYAYDAAGHTTSYASMTASYNNAGRLKTVSNGSATETMVYDALGQRVKISGGAGGTVLYWYDEQGHLLGEYDGSGNLIEETVWLQDIPVATLRPSGASVAIYYVHSDHLNTPRQVTRPSDNVQMWTWFSDPFGTDAANANPSGAGSFGYNLRFPGQVFDGQVGLHSNGFRDFDPATGRYIQSDPSGLNGGVNTYAYAFGAPLSRSDLLGLAPEREEFPPEATDPAEADPLAAIEYQILLSKIRDYERDFEDPSWRAPNSPPTRSDVVRLQDVLRDLRNEGSCPAPKEFRDPRRKPGSLGQFKGTDALRAENKQAEDAAKAAGLTQDQARELHDEISGRNLPYAEILEIAVSIKNGTH
jgi:RHS repeat-associated protein